ncbi:RsmE family RNA methyltransferase [Fusibacter sp. JL298sf-3]
MHRFFLSGDDRVERPKICIEHQESYKHLVKVLRAKVGEAVECVGEKVFTCEIASIEGQTVIMDIQSERESDHESAVAIDLYQCLPKGPKLEWIVQKNVELGVRDFYLVASDRCVATWKNKDVDKKLERYERIAQEAAKQSKRDYVSSVNGLLPFEAVLKAVETYDLFLVLYENASGFGLKEALRTFEGQHIAVLVGPEGGFSEAEIERLREKTAVVTLGKRILRTETAGLAAVTCIQYELGAMS